MPESDARSVRVNQYSFLFFFFFFLFFSKPIIVGRLFKKQTFIHRYNIALAHSFTHFFLLFFPPSCSVLFFVLSLLVCMYSGNYINNGGSREETQTVIEKGIMGVGENS